ELAAMSDPCHLTLSQAAGQIRAGELSPVELTRAYLHRIEKLDPQIRAWKRVTPEAALQRATKREEEPRRGEDLGPLHGIPIGVKDVFYTAGLETSAGSPILAGFIPDFNAVAVQKLYEAGAVVLGKTATTEFAFFDPAPTRNPHNLEHTPGGSSAGS